MGGTNTASRIRSVTTQLRDLGPSLPCLGLCFHIITRPSSWSPRFQPPPRNGEAATWARGRDSGVWPRRALGQREGLGCVLALGSGGRLNCVPPKYVKAWPVNPQNLALLGIRITADVTVKMRSRRSRGAFTRQDWGPWERRQRQTRRGEGRVETGTGDAA